MSGQQPVNHEAAGPGTRVPVAGLSCTVCSIPELVRWLGEVLARPRAVRGAASVLCVNAHIFNLAWDDPRLRERLDTADVLALDGMAMVWAARRAMPIEGERCNMTEALHAFLAAPDVPPSRALLIGLDEGAAQRAAATVNALGSHCQVVAARHGYHDADADVAAVLDADVDLVLVGCGTPRSEEVVSAVVASGAPVVAWHVGGGTLQFLAGDAREAPRWMRRSGLQWLHRLLAQPRRMWRRYLLGNPLFVSRVLRGSSPDA